MTAIRLSRYCYDKHISSDICNSEFCQCFCHSKQQNYTGVKQ